jgi:hypothetical protein
MYKLLLQPKKAGQNQPNMKALIFCGKGVVPHEFVPCGQTANGHLQLKVMKRLRETEGMKRSEGWRNKTWMLHHDSAPAQT